MHTHAREHEHHVHASKQSSASHSHACRHTAPYAHADVSDLIRRLLDARTGRRSTAVATNIDFKAWADYLGDPPLATAFLDRLVDGAVILKLTGRSYRAHRARPVVEAQAAD